MKLELRTSAASASESMVLLFSMSEPVPDPGEVCDPAPCTGELWAAEEIARAGGHAGGCSGIGS